jgi:SAM-dependent methyltransferase
VFSPVIPPLDQSLERPLTGESLSRYVQQVAEELGDHLDRAEAVSSAWSNAPFAEALVDAAVRRCLARLEATGCVGEANRLPSSRLWNLLGHRLEQSWLVNRARTKPRGYAGDFEILEWICQNRVCDHPFGRTLDRFFQNQAAPNAVRARTELVAAAIVGRLACERDQMLRVVHVGSGPAADLGMAAKMLGDEQRSRLAVTLLDLDPAAIEFARERLSSLLPQERLDARQVNLMRLPERNEALPEADVIACPGLFDYLDDAAAAEMLSLFWRRLRPGGLLMVGNFTADHPTRSYMEWIGNWYLIYRTAADLKRLAAQAGIPREAFSITCERFGIDLFLVAQKS